MIDEIDILHEGHSGDFANHSGEKSAGLFCVIAYHHKTVVELGEHSLYPLSELFVSPCRRSPVFLIQPIRDLQSDVGGVKKILLHLGAEIPFVSKYRTVVIFPLHILEVIEIVDTCRRHVVGMDNATYSTDCVELISVIIHSLRCAVAPVGSRFGIAASHRAASGPCVLTHLYRLGVNAENIFSAINGGCHVPAYFLGEPCRQLASGVELPAADQVWQIVLAFVMQAVKKEILAVKAECLGSYAESDYFDVRELRDNATTGYISKFIHTISGEILADSEDSDEICYEVAHKQMNSSLVFWLTN